MITFIIIVEWCRRTKLGRAAKEPFGLAEGTKKNSWGGVLKLAIIPIYILAILRTQKSSKKTMSYFRLKTEGKHIKIYYFFIILWKGDFLSSCLNRVKTQKGVVKEPSGF